MNELYPLKFEPILKDKIWGGSRLRNFPGKGKASDKCGESWEISGYENDISVVSEGFLQGNNLEELIEVYMGDLVGDRIFDFFGLQFPLLIKLIEANDVLSIQVHPDDEMAMEKHNAFGKTEMWFVIEADKGAQLISGFKSETNREEYLRFLNEGKITELLNYETVEKGDVFFMPAGRVHAIGKGILLAEIQQTSDLTYRIYDFNRPGDNGKPRELHTELALDAIDFNHYDQYKTPYTKAINKTVQLASCRYFTTNLINLTKPVIKEYNLIDSFVVYLCTEGKVDIIPENQPAVSISKGETVLVPAMLKQISIVPVEKSVLLEVYIG